MAMSEAQELNLSNQRAARAQDKKIPLCINTKDGRLMPNVKAVRENPDYRPFAGDPNADLRTRMMSLSVGVGSGVRVVASKPVIDVETFDVSTATKDELTVFAFDEYGLVLEQTTHIATMRKQILAASERAAAGKATQGDDLS